MIEAGKNIITEAEYQILVERCSDRTYGSYIPKILVSDYSMVENRSFLGRFLFTCKDFFNTVKILSTVVGYPMSNENIAWCHFDFAVACYRLTGDVDTALKRLYLVRQWTLNNPDQLKFLSVDEITRAINKVKQRKN